ncbi:MAG TPA: hypothetical protein VHR39_18925, partial [Propionibacteriaceae bacterium]|nr:hypothetical protein [Propionibacteriaceae bacterium]
MTSGKHRRHLLIRLAAPAAHNELLEWLTAQGRPAELRPSVTALLLADTSPGFCPGLRATLAHRSDFAA